MMMQELTRDAYLEFEQAPSRTDILVSRPFRTPDGDMIRATITVPGSIVLTRVREPIGVAERDVSDFLEVAVVTGLGEPSTVAKSTLGGIWDKIAGGGKALLDAVIGLLNSHVD